MADFESKKHATSEFNGGTKYTSGDGVQAETINNTVENALSAADSAKEAYNYAVALTATPDTSQAGNVGTPTVTLIDNGSYKKFKFANLRGEDGRDVLLYGGSSITQSRGFYYKYFNHTPHTGETAFWICSSSDLGYSDFGLYLADFIIGKSGYDDNGEVVYYPQANTFGARKMSVYPVSIANTGEKDASGNAVYRETFDNDYTIDFDVTAITGVSLKEQDADGNNVYTLNLSDGTSFEFIANRGPQGEIGKTGETGPKGDDGVGIESITVQTSSQDDGENKVNIRLTDDTVTPFAIKNGSKGSTGNDYLYCLAQVETAHILYSVGDEITISSSGFNRTPDVGEYFFVSVKHSDKANPYLYYAKVTSSVTSGNTVAEIVSVCIGEKGKTGDTGEAGSDGKDYLFYGRIWSEGKKEVDEVITNMSYSDFSRTPVIGDRLFYITQDSAEKRYVYYGVITAVSGDYATMQILALCNGEDGATGATGPQGEKGDKGDTALTVTVGTVTTGDAGSDASVVNSGTDTDLVLDFILPKGENGDDCLYYTNDSNISTNVSLDEVGVTSHIQISNFNRTPKTDERFIAVIYNSTQEKTAFFKVESVVDLTVTVKVVSYLSVELPEETGSVEFNKYTLNVADTLAGRKRLYDVVSGAKGNVTLYSLNYKMALSGCVHSNVLYVSGTKTTASSVTTLTVSITNEGSMVDGGEFHSVQTADGITFDKKVYTSNLQCVYYNDTEIT